MADVTARPRWQRKIVHPVRVRLAMTRYGVPDDGNRHRVHCHYCHTPGYVKVWAPGTYVRSEWPARLYATGRRVSSDLTIDHVHPFTQGGTNDLDNLVFACAACNTSKAGRTVDEWTEWLHTPRGLRSSYWQRVRSVSV